MDGLDKADDFKKFTASSADTDIFTVSTGSDAVSGSYTISRFTNWPGCTN